MKPSPLEQAMQLLGRDPLPRNIVHRLHKLEARCNEFERAQFAQLWESARLIAHTARPRSNEFGNLMRRYTRRFGEPPPLFAWGHIDAARAIRRALRTGRPMSDYPPGIPPGAEL